MVFKTYFHNASFNTVLPNCHMVNRWPMTGLSVRDHKPAKGLS